MAKKTKRQNKKASMQKAPDNLLPQNILPVGERVEEDKNIYISQAVYRQIRKFTKNKTTNESGGMLVGTVIEEFGKTNIVISGFVEAKACEATPTTLKFTHETWDYVHRQIDKKHKGKKIVGWIHTHPDFGIFLSEYDKFIHQNFFSEAYQVAYVVDPIQKIEGFYFWINGNIEKCKGFYIYENAGKPITVDMAAEDPELPQRSGVSISGILIALLTVVVAFLAFSNMSTNSQIKKLEGQLKKLETQQGEIVNGFNSVIYQLDQVIYDQSLAIQELQDQLIDAPVDEEVSAPTEEETSEPTEGATENE